MDGTWKGLSRVQGICWAGAESSRSLSEEQQRHVRENMTGEELVIFDILTRPAPELNTAERTKRASERGSNLRAVSKLTAGE